MTNLFKRHWRDFSAPAPGKRFKESYYRRQRNRPSALHKKIIAIGGGILIMGVGFLLLFAPGPGILLLAIGAMLIAQESFRAARTLDWMDIRLRRLAAWGSGVWSRFLKRSTP